MCCATDATYVLRIWCADREGLEKEKAGALSNAWSEGLLDNGILLFSACVFSSYRSIHTSTVSQPVLLFTGANAVSGDGIEGRTAVVSKNSHCHREGGVRYGAMVVDWNRSCPQRF